MVEAKEAQSATSASHDASRLGVLIVEYRDPSGALRLAGALSADPLLEIVIISTGPTALRRAAPGVRIIHLPSNPGFGAALNRGNEALSERVEHILMCNTDIHLGVDSVRRIWRYAMMTGWAQVSPMIVTSSGLVQWDGGHVDFRRLQIVHEGLGRLPTPGPEARATMFVTGACMLVRRDAWRAVGGIREDFFLYGEDVDLSLRFRRAGFKAGVVRCVQVVHDAGGSVGRYSPLQIYLMTRNDIRFFREWSPHLWGRLGGWVVVPLRLAWRLLRQRMGLSKLVWILRGVADARRNSRYYRFQGRGARVLPP